MNRIIIKDPVAFRDAIAKDSSLFQDIYQLVEALDGRHPLAHHITRQSSVMVSAGDYSSDVLRSEKDIAQIESLKTLVAQQEREIAALESDFNE